LDTDTSLFFVEKTSVKGDFCLAFELVLLSFDLENSHGVKDNSFGFVGLFCVFILGKSVFKEVLKIFLVVLHIIVNFGIRVHCKYVLRVS
jgi:hypothetical protein